MASKTPRRGPIAQHYSEHPISGTPLYQTTPPESQAQSPAHNQKCPHCGIGVLYEIWSKIGSDGCEYLSEIPGLVSITKRIWEVASAYDEEEYAYDIRVLCCNNCGAITIIPPQS